MICVIRLSHVYHGCLGTEHKMIQMLFDNAKLSNRYINVGHCDGAKHKAYALNNHFEMFASLSVPLFFGRNDYYPFNRLDLEKFDPASFITLLDVHIYLQN